MNITREDTGTLSACISIGIKPEDYQERVSKKLKDYQRKANIPGFRPGMAPMALIQRTVGRAVLLEEVEKLVQESLYNYLEEEKISILGTPLENEEKTGTRDWEQATEFDFHFDIGLHPEFEIDLDHSIPVEYHKIIPTAEELDEEVQKIRRTYGEVSEIDIAGEEDILQAAFNELDGNGAVKEDGIQISRVINTRTFSDETVKESLQGITVNAVIRINPLAALGGDIKKLAWLLRIDEEEAAIMQSDFEVTVKKIERLEPAELSPELFEKVMPASKPQSYEEFRQLLKEEMASDHAGESNKTFFQSVRNKLMDLHPFDMPEEFLRKWISRKKDADEKQETVEPDYAGVFDSFRWQLIENKIVEKEQIRVEETEMQQYLRIRFKTYYYQQGYYQQDNQEFDKHINNMVQDYLRKEDNREETADVLIYYKLLELFKNKLDVTTVEMTHDAFHALHGDHHHHHNHDHDHDHDHEQENDHDHEHEHEH